MFFPYSFPSVVVVLYGVVHGALWCALLNFLALWKRQEAVFICGTERYDVLVMSTAMFPSGRLRCGP